MKVKIIHGGGYQKCVFEVDAVPRAGEVLALGNWEAPVEQVVHVPEQYREDGEPGIQLVLSGSHRARLRIADTERQPPGS